MEVVHVFDIATNTWFTQPTVSNFGFYPKGGPGICSVVASAVDNSSHNIYIYGDNDGTMTVFILTLPAFLWVRVDTLSDDDPGPTTTGHRCQRVHEKHMVVYRGESSDGTCDSDKRSGKFQGMAIYDMSSLEWTTKIELENQKYLVPELLYKTIGGK